VVARPMGYPEPRKRAALRRRVLDDRRLLRLKFLVILGCTLGAALLERL
jgi:hypothetical protein